MVKKDALSRLVLLGTTVVLLVYVSCIGIRNVFRYNRFKIDCDQALQQLDFSQKKNDHLHRQLKQIDDNSYWDLKAKEIGYIAKGDVVYKVLPKGME